MSTNGLVTFGVDLNAKFFTLFHYAFVKNNFQPAQ